MKLIVGLGNPGDKYADTRHNIGFRVVGQLALRAGMTLKKNGHQGAYGVGRIAGEEVMLLLPQTFMNLSGASVGSASKSLGIDPGDLIVVHDDIDLDFGVLKIKTGGGHGGHNGIRHIREVLGTGDFIRVKVGVGRGDERSDVSSHVLSRFNTVERKSLETVLTGVCEAIEEIIDNGVQEAMNAYNNKDLSE
ncbi:MAG: aminoacyl-tRNA hydrolase [Desulfuromonas sp.]|nr:MAG: aminoacyl-tRNA hydrolase [Desulfuromonas sp.]